ncbi:SDR family NAD(P)-dependent oxidoreductase [Thermoactinomyces mirandus]|uniref:SDR family oxidoreductase n=1 Tax=Thermoactinomyces mirandus TaxID=2756294 RepID=A0A7W1XRT6_9BACL|nr:SDR family oxidoreductase [Thermoactinomyces mirandus]MBA4602128.1 SDR family oxidoreductase [Thermoactinomyces mirandus]
MLLKNKTIIISGVLGDISNHSLRILKENGAYIIGFDKRSPDQDDNMDYIDEFFQGDVMDDEFLERLKREYSSSIDVILNNIGEGDSKYFSEITDKDMLTMFQVNCLSAVRLSRLFLKGMMEKKQGCIINFSSILAKNPVPTVVHYATSKAALIGLTKSLAIEFAPYNIRINTLLLGYSDTINNKAYFASEAGKNFIDRFIPTKKLVDKKNIGHLLTYLSSDAAESITGSAIVIDRGHTIW